LCVAAPPSDHEPNAYVAPFNDCGVVALIESLDPCTTVTVAGVVTDTPLTTSPSPDGLELNVKSTVFGCRLTLVVAVAPDESVAVNCNSRNDGYP
jgi:hypothetical protein